MDVLSRIKISSFFIRDIDGLFKKVPLRAGDILFSQFIESEEKKDFFLHGKIPKRILDIIHFISKTSWLEVCLENKLFHLSISVKPKTSDIKVQKIGQNLGERILFVLLTPETCKSVVINRDEVIGDYDILKFFI